MSVLFLDRLALAATPEASHGVEYITGANFSAYCASADLGTACKTYALGQEAAFLLFLQAWQRAVPCELRRE